MIELYAVAHPRVVQELLECWAVLDPRVILVEIVEQKNCLVRIFKEKFSHEIFTVLSQERVNVIEVNRLN